MCTLNFGFVDKNKFTLKVKCSNIWLVVIVAFYITVFDDYILTSSGMTQNSMNFSPSPGPNCSVPCRGDRSVLLGSVRCQLTDTVPYLPLLRTTGTCAVMFLVAVLSSATTMLRLWRLQVTSFLKVNEIYLYWLNNQQYQLAGAAYS